MTWLSNLADRLILQPTTNEIDANDLQRRQIDVTGGTVDVFVGRTVAQTNPATPVIVLKFPGAGGRAERSTVHPAELWPQISAEIWTINHRGYGNSTGPATIQNFADTCDRVWQTATDQFPGHRIVLCGNSLGCLSALYLAARKPATGIFLRNPPPLKQLISTRPRYAWSSLGLSKWIADQVPTELDALENARHCQCPAFFVQSEFDRVVPVKYQQMIIDNFGGQQQTFVIRGADHHHRVPDEQVDSYVEAVEQFGSQLV